MKNKLFAITLSLLLLLSGLLMGVQGVEGPDEKNIVNENDGERNEGDRENLDEKIKERSHMDRLSTSDSYRGPQENRLTDESWKSTNESALKDTSIKRESWDNIKNIPLEGNRLKSDYDVHDPIRIDGDQDFDDKAEEKNWSGNGTEEDPYIIEDYEIDGGGFGYALYIGNVTAHFEVNECNLKNASGGQGEYFTNSGLHLFNTSNGNIQENTLSNNSQTGVYLDHANNNMIANNTVHSNGGHEIFLEDSDNNEVKDNDIYGKNSSNTQDDVEYCQNSVLVQLESSDEDTIRKWGEESALKLKTDEIANKIGGRTSRIFPYLNMAEINLDDDVEVKSAVNFLANRGDVITAEPNYKMDFQTIPNDPGYDSLWAMPTIDAPQAWDITKGSEDVVVAVVDTGIDYNHPDLKDNMWTSEDGHHGYNAVNNSYDPMDDVGHGTHVAGTIGAVGDNDLGVVGVNWDVSLMGVKIGDQAGLTTANAIAGLEYVLEKRREGENIVATSNSWGGPGYSELLREAIEEHQKEDISFVAAAGNARADTDETPFYPANYDLTNIISVAATNETDDLATFSNYGRRSVHVGAPGVNINSTILDGDYGYASGTSMAAPHVSGLIALMKADNPTYDHNQLKNALLSSADDLESLQDLTLTEGRINAYDSLEITPDPDDIRFWIHRPTTTVHWGEKTPISISINDGVDPVLGANVSVDFISGEDTLYLEDDGSGGDLPEDGYYTGKWTPQTLGEANLTITVSLEDQNLTKNLTVEIVGDSGIALLGSQENYLSDNNISNKYYGIFLLNSDSNEMSYNLIEDNKQAGIKIDESKNNEVINQVVSSSLFGVLIENSDKNSLSNSHISDTFMGVRLLDSKRNTFSNNNLSQNSYGFIIESSEENKFTENDIYNNLFYGMILYRSNNNWVENNFVENHRFYGIFLLEAEDNSLDGNTVSHTMFGFYVLEAEDNELDNNAVSNTTIGIYLINSEKITLTSNDMNDAGIYIGGLSIKHWNTHTIDTSNTVNGDPVYYWKNENGGTISQDAGQIILANCDDVTIKDQDISGGSVGILLGFSSENTLKENSVRNSNWEGITLFESDGNVVENNLVSENEFPGIFLFESEGNEIANNTASKNDYGIITFGAKENAFIYNTVKSNEQEGITLFESERNVLKNNLATENKFPGIFLYRSSYNDIIGNTAEENGFGLVLAFSKENTLRDNTALNNDVVGIFLETSNQNSLTENIISYNSEVGIYIVKSVENLVYRNQIIENEVQAFDSGENEWDAGDPADEGEGGNYWSDYQGENRGDGIGDEPYSIEGDGNQDMYPWISEEMILEEEKEKNILDIIVDRILDLIDGIERPDRPETPEIPGFTSGLLLFSMFIAVAIYHKKK